MKANPAVPREVEVIERIQESDSVFTLRLRFTDPAVHAAYSFHPGQFNMVHLYGVGEVPISIVSDPEDDHLLDHTIRAVGRVTRGLAALGVGDRLGVRGPFGRGWPLIEAQGSDVLVLTGGLGCAPSVSAINYILRRRERYGRLVIIQGVRHVDDLIWRDSYRRWAQSPDTTVLLAANEAGPGWPWHVGMVTELLDKASLDTAHTTAMMCGPEGMMRAGVLRLLDLGMPEDLIYISTERNMQCGVGRCGHCQIGPNFVCRDGPVFAYPQIKQFFGVRGY
jgi:NAD(P)H-flavin reductase